MNCPLCFSESRFAFYAKMVPVNDCLACGHRFAEISGDDAFVRSIYGPQYFWGGGAGYANYEMEEQLLICRGSEYAKLLERYGSSKGWILDVGAAAGFVLKGFIDEGWKGVGLEPSEEVANLGREKYGLKIVNGTLESLSLDAKFDVISMIQVAAHFYNPSKAFKNAHNLLCENGLLLIETWDRESLLARLFGRHWHEYSPPSVLHYFSKNGLTEFLEKMGFTKVADGVPKRTITGDHARSLLKYRLGNWSVLNLIPDRLKIRYPGGDLFWAIFRK